MFSCVNYNFSSKTNTNYAVCLFQNSFFDQFIWIKPWKYCFDSIIKTPPFLITHGRQVLLIKYYYLTVSNRVWHFSFNFATFNVKNEFDISESIFKTKINLIFVLELSCPFQLSKRTFNSARFLFSILWFFIFKRFLFQFWIGITYWIMLW